MTAALAYKVGGFGPRVYPPQEKRTMAKKKKKANPESWELLDPHTVHYGIFSASASTPLEPIAIFRTTEEAEGYAHVVLGAGDRESGMVVLPVCKLDGVVWTDADDFDDDTAPEPDELREAEADDGDQDDDDDDGDGDQDGDDEDDEDA